MPKKTLIPKMCDVTFDFIDKDDLRALNGKPTILIDGVVATPGRVIAEIKSLGFDDEEMLRLKQWADRNQPK